LIISLPENRSVLRYGIPGSSERNTATISWRWSPNKPLSIKKQDGRRRDYQLGPPGTIGSGQPFNLLQRQLPRFCIFPASSA
jgi:hypothetical protein